MEEIRMKRKKDDSSSENFNKYMKLENNISDTYYTDMIRDISMDRSQIGRFIEMIEKNEIRIDMSRRDCKDLLYLLFRNRNSNS